MHIEVNAKKIALWLYILLTLAFIAWTIWGNFRTYVINAAYLQGKADAVTQVIEQSNNENCQAFNIFVGENKADLVNVKCLQQAQPTVAPAIDDKG